MEPFDSKKRFKAFPHSHLNCQRTGMTDKILILQHSCSSLPVDPLWNLSAIQILWRSIVESTTSTHLFDIPFLALPDLTAQQSDFPSEARLILLTGCSRAPRIYDKSDLNRPAPICFFSELVAAAAPASSTLRVSW